MSKTTYFFCYTQNNLLLGCGSSHLQHKLLHEWRNCPSHPYMDAAFIAIICKQLQTAHLNMEALVQCNNAHAAAQRIGHKAFLHSISRHIHKCSPQRPYLLYTSCCNGRPHSRSSLMIWLPFYIGSTCGWICPFTAHNWLSFTMAEAALHGFTQSRFLLRPVPTA